MKRLLLAVALVLGSAPLVAAHQIDEYLQASRLEISRDRIVVEIDLTPGVSVAPGVLAMIDRDGSGRIDPHEIEAYARAVVAGLSLHVDDRPYPLTLVRADAPSGDEIREGTGRMRVEATAAVPLNASGRHSIAYDNADRSPNGVYLVNVLKPERRQVQIIAQHRDRLQHSIAIDVVVTNTFDSMMWLGFSAAGLAALTWRRSANQKINLKSEL